MKLNFLILFFLILLTIWPELRIGYNGFQTDYINQLNSFSGVGGYPRVIEIVAIIFIFLNIKNIKIKFLNILIFLFLLLITIALIFHGGFSDVWRSGFLIPLLTFIILQSVHINWYSTQKIIQLVNLVGLISGIIIIVQIFLPNIFYTIPIYDAYVEVGRRYAGLGQSHAYQSFVQITAFITCLFSLNIKSFKKNRNLYFSIIRILIILISIILTGSRTGYIISLIIIFMFLLSTKSIVRKKIIFSTIYFMVVSATLFFNQLNILIFEIFNLLKYRSEFDLFNRSEIWEQAFIVAINNPILGVNNFISASNSLGFRPYAHEQNGFLAIANYAGIFAFFLYLLIIGNIFQPFMSNKIDNKPINFLMIALFINYFLFMMTEIIVASIQAQILFFIVTGVIFNYSLNMKKQLNDWKII
ncbi:MAG: O-antigen ligase family protein [Ignavibacterium album]|uniref:O-antigen ligase family protein n=1 Tax=Ignavibacterium album TaxID=591197 RepID=UPI0026EE0BFA|nr:O-antigen ligase family protein [Ignavibacterium album]MBI5663324.1 O-antigen ligase family protein [Ignavibacterium album]